MDWPGAEAFCAQRELCGSITYAPQWTAGDYSLVEATVMWRAFFLAVGIFLCILGAECLAVETFEMAPGEPDPQATPATMFGNPPQIGRHIQPAEWAPWSFLSAGAVIILYSLTINRQG